MNRQGGLFGRWEVYRNTAAEPAGVAVCCTTCQDTYEPSVDDWESGHTGCRWCGGWTFSAAVW